MEEHSSSTYRESSQKTKSSVSSTAANGRNDSGGVSLRPGGDPDTYNKVHHDLDAAAAHRKPLETESKYKVKTAEPGVDTLPLADHDHVGEGKRVEKKTRVTGESQKGQFIAKPDVYGEKGRGGGKEEKDGDEFPWMPLLGGAVAIVGVIAGAIFYRKRNPDVDVKFRRSVEGADHRVKGAIGSGERKVKELFGSGQQKFNNLIHRGERHDEVDDDEDYDDRHSRGHNALNVFGGGESYQVKQGDNLTKIAKKSGKKSWHDIADKNPSIRNPDLIYPGDRLKV